MDDLTQRALTQLNTATANHSDKQQREVEQRSLTEAPAFVTGFAGGKYLVERLGQEPTATGVAVTNGLLQTGRRVTTTGQFVDGVPRVKTVQPAVATVEAMGKIKYLYSIVNPTTRKTEYWVGGWQAQPKFLFAVEDFLPLNLNPRFNVRLNNRTANQFTVDFGKATGDGAPLPFLAGLNKAGYFGTLNQTGTIVDQSRLLVGDLENFFTIGLVANSFYYAPANDASSNLIGSWTTCFQGDAISGYTSDTRNIVQYLLPRLTSPDPVEVYRGSAPDNTGRVSQTFAINQRGDRGIGRLATRVYSQSQLYWLEDGVMDTTDNLTLLPLHIADLRDTYKIDCFNNTFSVFSRSDLSLTTAKQVEIDLYQGVTGIKTRTTTTKVFPLPPKQQSQAPVLIDASYHP